MTWDSLLVLGCVVGAALYVGWSLSRSRRQVCQGGCPNCSAGITGKCAEKNDLANSAEPGAMARATLEPKSDE